MKNINILLITFIFLAGCASKNIPPVVEKEVKAVPVKKKSTNRRHTTQPKKDIKLKEVEDTNYSSAYMYPEDKVKKDNAKKEKVEKEKFEQPKKTALATNTTMNKAECIAMIGQEKFDKYTAMFGSEKASIKRCNMIKTMNQ